ncbi:hypothetical protein F4808DRAFT_438237 [Astrocystis sublimbata]|nr:hypothetical protein F4808DRAFT_438237 [Astrocystis sublimbata]
MASPVAVGEPAIHVISELEHRYIRLLEKKIANLESQLEHRTPEPGPKPKAEAGAETEGKDPGGDKVAKNRIDSEVNDDLPEEGQIKTSEDESRYHMVILEWDARKGAFKESLLPGIEDVIIGPENKPNRAFTFRKIVSSAHTLHAPSKNEFSSSEFDIIFPPLQKLLGEITSMWGWSEEVTRCASPYIPLIWSWEEAQQKTMPPDGKDESDDEKQARKDLSELLRIISTSSGDALLDRYFKNRQLFKDKAVITHNSLWTLFPPGTFVLGRPCHNEYQVFITDWCTGFVADGKVFELVCHSFDWDGFEYNRVPYQLTIDGWGGDSRSVTSLSFYPLKYYKEDGLTEEESQEKLTKRLVERGRNYAKFAVTAKGEQMFNYKEGDAYFPKGGSFLTPMESETDTQQNSSSSTFSDSMDGPSAGLGSSWKLIEGAVIVDFDSYLTYQSASAPTLGPLLIWEGGLFELSPEQRAKKTFKDTFKLDWDRVDSKKELSEQQYLCCPPRLLGYALKRKTWVQLLVDHMSSPADANNSTFQNELQLDEEAKDLISKSVLAHSKSRKRKGGASRGLDDFAPEKGRGLVIMLYGQPGVGKTLTAESVAQMTSKPLLSVGVSDIGIEGDKVEMNLQKVFALAGLWEAVLLFDEADVFLESRGEGDNDLRRNAMVSVLLRVLEYYEGILILTTNRMRSLDIAVQSRIHLAIKFVELNPEQKVRIFESFLTQLASKNLVSNYKELETWVKKEGKRYDFNGRQIRNVISTALGIALADEKKLEKDHLASVARQTDEFKRDLSTQEAIYKDRQISQRA